MNPKEDKPSKKNYQCPACQSTHTEGRGRQFHCLDCDTYHSKDPMRVNTKADGTVVVTTVIPEGVYTKKKIAEILGIDLKVFRIKQVEYSVHHMARKDRKGWWKASLGEDGKGKVEGESHDSGKMLVVPLMNMKVTLEERVAEMRAEQVVTQIFDQLKKESPKIPKVKYNNAKANNMLEVFVPDAHFGRSVWGEETGGIDYDMRIAEKVFSLAVESILSRVDLSQVGRILFPLGNDFFNIDGPDMETTRGTKQTNDPHWRRTFANGSALAIRTIERLNEIAPVDVMMVEGNHDKNALFYLGTVLQNRFWNNKNVTVENKPTERKVYEWGRAGIGYFHGERMKPQVAVDKFNNEFRKSFADKEFKEIHAGHWHHEKIARVAPAKMEIISEEYDNVFVRYIRALTPTDMWHFNGGFTGAARGCEGFLWNKKEGLLGLFPAIIDEKKYR